MNKRNLPALLLALSLFIWYGCAIGDEPTPPPPTAYFIVHASPNAPNLDIISNAGVNAINFGYKKDSGYYFVPGQTYEFRAAPTGTTNYIVTAMIPLDANKFYSLFLIDSLSKIKLVAVNDNLKAAGTDSSNIRLLQFSPNAPYLDAELHNSTDTLEYKGRSFNDQATDTTRATFKPIRTGSYTLALYIPGSSTPFAEFPGFSFVNGKSYTVYIRGFNGGMGAQALDAGIIQNTE